MIRIKIHNPIFGVPITFLNYHNPEEWRIIGRTYSSDKSPEIEKYRIDPKKRHSPFIGGKELYKRILIQKI